MTALAILQTLFDGIRPPEQIAPSAWAERNLVLPRESNARPGRPKLTALQRGMVDAAVEPGVREVVFMTSAQIGKTFALHAILGHAMATDAGPMMVVRPDDADAMSYVRETLDPLLQASPALRAIVGAGNTGVNNSGFKTFPGGSLALASSYKASALAGRSVRVLLADEIDRFAAMVSTGEGEPVALAKRRAHTFPNSLIILASTPTLKSSSRIAQHYERGDRRLFYIPCLACGTFEPITSDRLIVTSDAASARLACLHCNHHADEGERLDMLAAGHWQATAAGEPGVVSFHANELASEFSSLEKVAQQVLEAQTFEQKKVLTNLCWGQPFEGDFEAQNDASDLQSRAEASVYPLPREIEFITAGVDVQSSRVETMFVGHGKGRERWIINHARLEGDTSGDAVWRELHDYLGSVFEIADGRKIALSATFIDAGFNTQRVVDFVALQRRHRRNVHPTFGRSGWDKPTTKAGARIRGQMRGIVVGVDNLKLEIVKALAIRERAPSFIHLPDHLDAEFFDQLASEKLETKYVKGFPRQTWVKDAGTRNEAFDCLVYACAAATIVNKPARSLADKRATSTVADTAARLSAIHNPEQEKVRNYG